MIGRNTRGNASFTAQVFTLFLPMVMGVGCGSSTTAGPEGGDAGADVNQPDAQHQDAAADANTPQDSAAPLEGIQTRTLIENRAIASWQEPVEKDDPRPVLVFMPGWGGNGSVNASVSSLNRVLVEEGYITLAVGFDSDAQWSSNLRETVKNGLDALCNDAAIPARCSAIALVGTSYSGSQNYWVTNYLRQNGYDGSGGREIIAFLSEDTGYGPPGEITDYNTGAFNRTGLADVAQYGVAMIENQGDPTFPIDACTWGNCGIRVLARAHADAGHQQVLSQCPPGGNHGSREYATWNSWVISALKTMIHEQQGAPKFAGYTEPTTAVSNDCL